MDIYCKQFPLEQGLKQIIYRRQYDQSCNFKFPLNRETNMEEKTKDLVIGFIAGTASGIVTLYIFYNYIAKNMVQQAAKQASEETIIKYRQGMM